LARISDGELSVTEFGDLEVVVFGIWSVFLSLLMLMVLVVTVRGPTMTVRCAHIDVSTVFAGAAAICGHTAGPALAIAGGCSIHELQGLVFDVWIGVGREGPDSADFLVHEQALILLRLLVLREVVYLY
jgi:hypothetical protein